MSRILANVSTTAVLLLIGLVQPVQASQRCIANQTPYELSSDIVNWTMSIAPGGDCIQGLRWSYMQINFVSVLGAPKNGKVVIVGSGFRYYADPDFHGSDSFVVVVSGKNRKTPGDSVLQIHVNASGQTKQASLDHN